MNEQNLSYLKDNIKYQGFGETLHTELENQLRKNPGEFRLGFKSEINKRQIEATLYFKRSETSDMYFFNKYDVRTATEKKDEPVAQTFYINKGHGVTLKEAYNLLNGRAIHKELTDKQDHKYHAWIQLDFSAKDKNGNYERKQYHENYGYDIREALSYYPIKEGLNAEEKEKLIRSLEKGNVQMVTIDNGGKEQKVFIEANPQPRSLNVYNNKMEMLDKEQLQELMQKPVINELSNEKKTDKTQSTEIRNVSEDKGILQKNRVSDKKGLGI